MSLRRTILSPQITGLLEVPRFVANDSYSIVDIALGARVALDGLVEYDLRPFRNIVIWLQRLEESPAWQSEEIFIEDMKLIRNKGLI